MKHVRTRIAPSPTGEDLHIGNVYTALINYVFAKKNKGEFIVRIEDTDQTRLVKASEERIFSSLDFLGLIPDESPIQNGPYAPYRQSQRLDLYQKYAHELVAKGHAYYCVCTSERLSQMRLQQQEKKLPPLYDGKCREAQIEKKEPYTVRLKVPREGITQFIDLIRGNIQFENKLIDDQVILKSDGFPTYHLGVVVDDHLMQISHVIRAEEWVSSTPKHILLYDFFGWERPQFAHLPLLRNPDKSKLSKRKNPVWMSWYREQGFLPEAILNYLGTLGWSIPQTLIDENKKQGIPEELFSVSQMIEYFELDQIKTSAPVFDLTKLEWLNGEYIRKTHNSQLKTQIYDFFNKKYSEEKIEQILPLIKERIKTLKEFENVCLFFFEQPLSYQAEINKIWLDKVAQEYDKTEWRHEQLLQVSRATAETLGVPFKKLAMDIRVATTGKTVGPPLFESIELLGKEEALMRIRNALNY